MAGVGGFGGRMETTVLEQNNVFLKRKKCR